MPGQPRFDFLTMNFVQIEVASGWCADFHPIQFLDNAEETVGWFVSAQGSYRFAGLDRDKSLCEIVEIVGDDSFFVIGIWRLASEAL